MKTNFSFLLATTAAFTAASVQAQDAPVDLGTLVLSGGLVPVESSALGRSSTVLTEQEIDTLNTRYVADVLRQVPGVAVSRTGSFGGLTQVRIRGHEGNHTLVLIDGVEVAAPNQGEYDFGGLLSADVERIEVLRGPQSSLYGSNAIGGVISITTKRATEPGFSGESGFVFGSDDTREARLALRYSDARGDLSFSAIGRDTGGFDISGTSGGEDDGDLNRTYNLNGRFFVTDDLTVGGTLRHSDRVSDTDEFNFAAPTTAALITDGDSNAKVQETFGSLFAELDLMDGRLRNRLDLSFANIDRQGRDGAGVKNQDNSGTRRKLSYQGTYALDGQSVDLANHLLTLAAEWERLTYQENDATIVFGPGQLEERTREQTALIAEYQGRFDNGFALQGSLRHDNNDKFKDFTTYALGVSYTLPNQTTRVHASYGTGVQNPTLIEQFGFFSDFVGNPNLKPEQSKGWDIGIEQQFLDGRGLVDLTYFNEELTDEIGSVFDQDLGASTPVNRDGTSERQGIELGAQFDINDRLTTPLSYTWLDATEPVPTADGGTRNAIEVRRPEHELSLGVNYTLPNDRTRLSLDVTHVAGLVDLNFKTASFVSGNVDDDFDRVELDDYTLVNVGFTHDFNETVLLQGGINNLLDEDYQELEGYATQGRVAFIGLTARF